MKVLFDIGHPAHFHFFKKSILSLEEKGGEVIILARDKDCSLKLIKEAGLKYVSRGVGATGFFKRIFYLLSTFFMIRKIIKKEKPDIMLCFGSPYTSLARRFSNTPLIFVCDSEPNKFEKLFYKWPDVILTPDTFTMNFGERHKFFKGIKEHAYLNSDMKKKAKSGSQGEPFALIRFISFSAIHYSNDAKVSWQERINLVKEISKLINVRISSEEELPVDLQEFELDIKASDIHSVLARAKLLVSESATMSAEGALLGVPTIMISSLNWGYIQMLEKRKLINRFWPGPDAYEKTVKLSSEILSSGLESAPELNTFINECDDINALIMKEISCIIESKK